MNQWVVWAEGTEGWWPHENMSREQAERKLAFYAKHGIRCRIHPKHHNTFEDVVNG